MGHTYNSRSIEADGTISWSRDEHDTWKTLFERQMIMIETHACREHISGIERLGFSGSSLPQHRDLDSSLRWLSSWHIAIVPAIVPDTLFYSLLAERRFPCTSFIRIPEELDYLEEPDIFHEFFGHLPLLTWAPFADFLEKFGQCVLHTEEKYQKNLFRIFWFTVEFWLIQTHDGMKIYGAGILSSHGETPRSLDTDQVTHTWFDPLTCARTTYRHDIMQSQYFFIEDFDEIFGLFDRDIMDILREAERLWDI